MPPGEAVSRGRYYEKCHVMPSPLAAALPIPCTRRIILSSRDIAILTLPRQQGLQPSTTDTLDYRAEADIHAIS